MRQMRCECGRMMGYNFAADWWVCSFRPDLGPRDNVPLIAAGCGRRVTGQELWAKGLAA